MSFESEVHDIDEVTKRLKISIPAAIVEAEFESAIKNLMGSAKVKGFRQGKAPRQMIEQQHGSRVRMEVANRLISSSLQDTITKLKIDMVGLPEIDVSSFEAGQEIRYTAEVSLFPSPKVSGYDNFEVSVPQREIDDKEVDQVIENLRERSAIMRKLEFRSSAQMGDVVDAQAVIYLDGDTPSAPEPLVVRLGEGLLPKEVEEGLVGIEVGETRELGSTIPDDHADEKIRGKQARYKITLNALSERVLPEVSDDWVKTLNLGAETVLELRIKARETLEADAKRESESAAREAILKQLLERNQFKVPNAIVDDQIRNLLVRSGVLDPAKVDPNRINMEPFREKLGAAARERACTLILIDTIARDQNIRAADAEADQYFQELAQGSNVPEDQVRKYFKEGNRMVGVMMELTRNKVIDMLAAKAKITYTKPEVSAVSANS